MTTHNKFIDKDGMLGALTRPMLGDSIIFNSGSEEQMKKRKHCAHAFYKNHMSDM